ncbi:MAG TPA: phage holin family protein [Gemmatimonadaceae bacterium]|nr:phage holin family protein [Gemmatimonadaceae bacterium]
MAFVARLLINAAALWVAVQLVPGVTFTGRPLHLVAVALVFGLVNAIIRPLLLLLSVPLLVVTLGLFMLVLNGFLLWITSALSGALGLGFQVHGILAAILGALVVTIVSLVLTIFLGRKGTRKAD